MDNITFENFDKFQRRPFADRLTQAIKTFHQFSDGAYVLSLNAKFGSGKTTFLKMWKEDLEAKNYKVLYLNAWETDFDEDPIIPLTAIMLDAITGAGAKKAKTALRGALGAAALVVGNKLFEQTTGINLNETMREVEKDLKESDLIEIGKEVYKAYDYKTKAYSKLRAALATYVQSLPQRPFVILVDELDRVRPDYSVKFLEAIKHIFPIPGICFVLAIDRRQLECSVRQLYGDLDFENYYRRFVTREVQLPASSKLDLNGYILQLSNEYFDRKANGGVSFAFDQKSQNAILGSAITASKVFNLTPRQIEYLFRILAHFLAIDSDRRAKEVWLRGAILLIALFISNPEQYHLLGNAKIEPAALYRYLLTLDYSSVGKSGQRYVIYDMLACTLKAEAVNQDQTAIAMAEYENKDLKVENAKQVKEEMVRMLSRTLNDWGELYEQSGFQTMYERLEDWRAFID